MTTKTKRADTARIGAASRQFERHIYIYISCPWNARTVMVSPEARKILRRERSVGLGEGRKLKYCRSAGVANSAGVIWVKEEGLSDHFRRACD